MDLTRPAALALLGLIPLLWWLAIPPRPRVSLSTAHLPLWEVALRRLRRQSERFRRLRFWLLALALAAVVVAAAGPVLPGRAGAEVVAVLLDDSSSMGAREPDGSSAFEAAREGIRRVVPTLPEGIRFRWGTVGPDGSPSVGRGTARDLLDALDGVELARGPGLALAEVAEALRGGPTDTAVWTWTDARGAAWDGDSSAGAVELVGAAVLPNAAWHRVVVEDSWPLPEIRFVGEFGWSGGADRPGIVVQGDAVEVESIEVSGDRGDGVAEVVIQALRRRAGEIELGFGGEGERGPWSDAQPGDDVVRVQVAPPGASRIGLLTARGTVAGSWLERSAELLAELAGGEVVEVGPGDRVDLLLVDGGLLEAPSPRSLTFGTAFGAEGGASAAFAPQVDDWDRRHPLTAGLDLSELTVRQTRLAPLPAGTVLIAGDTGPLAVACDGVGGRSVHLAFELGASNLPYLAAYPQLLRRALSWTAGVETRPVELHRGDRSEARLVRTGGAVRQGLPPLATPDRSLVGAFLLLALGLLAARSHVR